MILSDMYVRTVNVRSSNGTLNQYVRVVEAYREQGKVKQRVVADLGRKDLLAAVLPKLRRVLEGTPAVEGVSDGPIEVLDASTWGPVLLVRHLFAQLGLWEILDRTLGPSQGVAYADRAFVLVANRLLRPASEHGLAAWLESDFLCDRQGRRFVPRWQRRGRGRAEGVGPARLQPRRQAAQRAGDRRGGDGLGLADRPSRVGGQPPGPHDGPGGACGFAEAVYLWPGRRRSRDGH